jgi:DNA (cytosine-5)-methyltransferase 1
MRKDGKPRLLDLFCGAGGCTKGYQRAGFYVRGVDHKRQPRYCGEEFIQADALEYLSALIDSGGIEEFQVIHASPPCQFASVCTPMAYRSNHENLIPPTRELLIKSGKPYDIENVENARFHLDNPIKLCGTMFGLRLWRHRYFEIKPEIFALLPPCNHKDLPVLISGTTRRKPEQGGRFEFTVQQCRDASEIDWMVRSELDQAIPPAYTEFIGRQLMAVIERQEKQDAL